MAPLCRVNPIQALSNLCQLTECSPSSSSSSNTRNRALVYVVATASEFSPFLYMHVFPFSVGSFSAGQVTFIPRCLDTSPPWLAERTPGGTTTKADPYLVTSHDPSLENGTENHHRQQTGEIGAKGEIEIETEGMEGRGRGNPAATPGCVFNVLDLGLPLVRILPPLDETFPMGAIAEIVTELDAPHPQSLVVIADLRVLHPATPSTPRH